MRLNPDNTELWITNYKRPAELYDTIVSWNRSFSFKTVNVICNGGIPFEQEDLNTLPNVILHHQWQREEWEVGSIAQCWNIAMKKCFTHSDWCVMSQDDNIVSPGWADKINISDFLTYIAPAGDVVTIQSREGFKRVGWYDERFRAIGGPEADYQLRCMRDASDSSSIEDIDHIWKLSHNDVGLAQHFKLNHTAAALETRQGNLKFSKTECFDRWIQKYGASVDTMMCERDWRKSNPGWEEIDWYPSWTCWMDENKL